MAASGCDLVASPQGSDSASGSETDPLRSAGKLVSSLQSGQAGCLRGGTYDGENPSSGPDAGLWFHRPDVTLRSYPGERATIIGRVAVAKGANGVSVEGLTLNGSNPDRAASPFIGADDVSFIGNEVTNDHTGICFLLTGQGGQSYRVSNTLIADNRIHDCGTLPANNHEHGIYIQRTEGAVIRDNVIYDNADRGIQLYPDAQNTLISGNVIDGNGSGVIISGDLGTASNGTLVIHNVIANSKLRYNVEENYPEGNPIGHDNVVRENCIGGSRPSYGGVGGSGLMPDAEGFAATGNVFATASYTDREAGIVDPGSPCAAMLKRSAGLDDGGAVGAPDQTSSTSSTDDVSISLQSNQHRVKSGKRVKLRGRSRGARSPKATILMRRDHNWKSVAHARVRSNGSFQTRRRLRGHSVVLFRAALPDGSISRPIRVRVR